jgi:hypothetical protein
MTRKKFSLQIVSLARLSVSSTELCPPSRASQSGGQSPPCSAFMRNCPDSVTHQTWRRKKRDAQSRPAGGRDTVVRWPAVNCTYRSLDLCERRGTFNLFHPLLQTIARDPECRFPAFMFSPSKQTTEITQMKPTAVTDLGWNTGTRRPAPLSLENTVNSSRGICCWPTIHLVDSEPEHIVEVLVDRQNEHCPSSLPKLT